MQVANCTTPANYFHILRRQLKRDFRKPLILMTPKSLLRHKRAVSRLDEMGRRRPSIGCLWDDAQLSPDEKIKLVPDDKIRRVVLCSGKVYYDLYDEREKRGIDDIYLLRIEQLYPFPTQGADDRAFALQAGGNRLVPGGAAQSWEPGSSSTSSSSGCSTRSAPRAVAPAMQAGRPRRRPQPGRCSLHVAQLKQFLEDALG